MNADDEIAEMNGWLDRCFPAAFRDVAIINGGISTRVVWEHPGNITTGLTVWQSPHPHGGFYRASAMYGQAWTVAMGPKLTDNARLDITDLLWDGALPHDPELAAKFLIVLSHHVPSESVIGGSA